MKRAVYYIPALLWALLTFYLSSRSSVPSIIDAVPEGDKLVHATFYGIFAFWFLFGARFPVDRSAWWCVVWVSLYGITDEIHQYYVPGRNSDVADWLADTCGGIVCVALWLRWRRRNKRKPA